MWANYHCHTHYCDGKNSVADHVEAAVQQQVTSLGISSHAPLPFPSKWCMKRHDLEQYLLDIETVKRADRRLEIYKGLEVDYIPNVVSPKDFKTRLDYVIGSIHFVDSFADGSRWEIDGLHNLFLEGLKEIFSGDIRQVITRYFELTREMVETSQPDIVGHLDKIKIQNMDNKFFDESESWYRSEVAKALDTIASYGCILEVNTRGLYQKKSSTPYPSPWILEQALSRNIPLTLSSDAHLASDMTNMFAATADLLQALGCNSLAYLSAGKWQARSIRVESRYS
jgi:histidinol-phosphatase (PHP family)